MDHYDDVLVVVMVIKVMVGDIVSIMVMLVIIVK